MQRDRRSPSTSSLSLADILRAIVGIILTSAFIWQIWNWLNSSPASNHCTRLTDRVNCGWGKKGEPKCVTFYDDPTMSYSIEKKMDNWGYKRRQWLKYHSSYAEGLKGRILVVTGSQPSVCPHSEGDHFLLRFFKNKVDYCRIHGYQIFYNSALLQPKMSDRWAKIPAIKAAMMAHPEAEWIFWIDSDAAFTDMDFKIPLKRYEDYNLVFHGWRSLIFDKPSWTGLNAGVFLIRNCQWSMELMDEWATMGPQTPDFEEWGIIQKSILKDKDYLISDDQAGIIYLLLKQGRWTNKVYIESEYLLHGYWLGIVGRFDNITKEYAKLIKRSRKLRRRHAERESEYYGELWEPYVKSTGYGDDGWRRPFITHFTGCQPCSGNHNQNYQWNECTEGMIRALNFADNQVLRNYGFRHPDLLDSAVSPLTPRQ